MKQFLERSGCNELLTKVSGILSSLKDNLQQTKELKNKTKELENKAKELQSKKSEALIVLLTTLLTIVLSFTGIKDITEKIIGNLYVLYDFHLFRLMHQHTLRISVIVWLLVIISLLPVIFSRFNTIRK